MCLPACAVQLAEAASTRRSFLRRSSIAAAAVLATLPEAAVAADAAPTPRISLNGRVIDLTHTLGKDFPFPVDHAFELEPISRRPKGMWNINRWHFHEHIGTHIDAPFHCSDGDTAERIPVEKLVGPLAVIDLRDRAARDADAELTPDDLKSWERRHGPIPPGAAVALCSGWDARVNDASRFFGRDAKGGFHMPGFHVEAVQFLARERQVIGIATDTISLDVGKSRDFPAHHFWLGQNKWGLENVANLGQLPPVGATVIVGCPKVQGASGGPSRVLAITDAADR
jgi:kynurenine formamidase